MKICVIYTDGERLRLAVERMPSLEGKLTGCRVGEVEHDESSIRFVVRMSTINEAHLRKLHSELIEFFDDIIYVQAGRKYRNFDPVYIVENHARGSSEPRAAEARIPRRALAETV